MTSPRLFSVYVYVDEMLKEVKAREQDTEGKTVTIYRYIL